MNLNFHLETIKLMGYYYTMKGCVIIKKFKLYLQGFYRNLKNAKDILPLKSEL